MVPKVHAIFPASSGKLLETAVDKNLAVRVAVAWSKGRQSPPNNKRAFCRLSRLLIKLEIWAPSIELEDMILRFRLTHTDLKLSLNSEQSKKKFSVGKSGNSII